LELLGHGHQPYDIYSVDPAHRVLAMLKLFCAVKTWHSINLFSSPQCFSSGYSISKGFSPGALIKIEAFKIVPQRGLIQCGAVIKNSNLPLIVIRTVLNIHNCGSHEITASGCNHAPQINCKT
jgi:hypothetical protein